MRKRVLAILGTVGALCLAAPANAGEVPSAFFVAKSQNKNQVHYGVHVDDACLPTGTAPVSPYWRMLERSPLATEGLTEREQKYYGIERQEVEGPTVRIVLRGLPSRPVVIQTWRESNGACMSASTMTIAGSLRRLYNIYVAVKLLGVDYLQLTGWAGDGAVVREKINPL